MSDSLFSLLKDSRSKRIVALIDSGSIDVNARSVSGLPAILVATAFGLNQVVKALLDAGADPDATDSRNRSACHAAVEYDRLPVLEMLIKRGANLNLRDTLARTPFCIAMTKCLENGVLHASMLIDAGADVHSLPPHTLCVAACQDLALLNKMLARNVDFSRARMPSDNSFLGSTPCHYLAKVRSDRSAALLRTLLGVARLDVDALDNAGCTPLFRAAECSNDSAISVLVEFGADVNTRGAKNRTALHILCRIPNRVMPSNLFVLLASGADVDRNLFEVAAKARARTTLCALLAAESDSDELDELRSEVSLICEQHRVAKPTDDEVNNARREIVRTRFEFVRGRAMEVCIGLQPLALDALQLCEIMTHACGPIGRLILFHQWWAIATTVKHFQSSKKKKSKSKSKSKSK